VLGMAAFVGGGLMMLVIVAIVRLLGGL